MHSYTATFLKRAIKLSLPLIISGFLGLIYTSFLVYKSPQVASAFGACWFLYAMITLPLSGLRLSILSKGGYKGFFDQNAALPLALLLVSIFLCTIFYLAVQLIGSYAHKEYRDVLYIFFAYRVFNIPIDAINFALSGFLIMARVVFGVLIARDGTNNLHPLR